MSNDDLSNAGFIDDDAPKKPAGGGAAGFDPFADVGNIDAGLSAPASPEPQLGGRPEADGIDPVEAGMPGLGSDMSGNADVQPGAAKDLWTCPHCGARNKPNRTDCRSCGKSPDEAVVPAWKKQLPLIAGGGVVLLIIIAWFLFGGTDMSLKAAGQLDERMRTSGSNEIVDVDGFTFRARSALAGSGRVLSFQPARGNPEMTAVFLVFGPKAADAAIFDKMRPDVSDSTVELKIDNKLTPTNDPAFALIHFLDPDNLISKAERGDYLSFVGLDGKIDDVASTQALARNEYVVLVRQAQKK